MVRRASKALEGSLLSSLEGACWPQLKSLRVANNRFDDLPQCELVVACRVGAAGAMDAIKEAAPRKAGRRSAAARAAAVAKAALAACSPLDVFDHVDRVYSDADGACVKRHAAKESQQQERDAPLCT